MGQPVTINERAERAHELEREIVAGCRVIRSAWVALAAFLHEFHADAMWEALGHATFNEWLGDPDVSLGRRHAYALIDAHRVLVLDKGVKPAALNELEATKVAEVLPAIKQGLDVEEALADVRVLSRSDLREKYHGDGTEPTYRKCECCGQRVKEAA
jgi:hypothetical protein